MSSLQFTGLKHLQGNCMMMADLMGFDFFINDKIPIQITAQPRSKAFCWVQVDRVNKSASIGPLTCTDYQVNGLMQNCHKFIANAALYTKPSEYI